MTKALQPWALRTGEALSPSYLNKAKAAVMRDLRDLRARRWAHNLIVIPFDDVTEADGAEERAKYFDCPWAIEVEGIEVFAYGDDNNGGAAAVDVTFTATGITGWEDIEIDFDASAAQEATEERVESNRRMSIAADQEVKISFTATPASGTTWRITRGAVVLHLRGDRYEGSQPAEPSFAFHTREANAATMVNTFTDDVATAVAADDDDGNVSFPQVLFVVRDNQAIGFTTTGRQHMAQCGRKIHSFDAYVVSAAVDDLTARIVDEAGATIATTTFAAAGTTATTSKSGRITATDTQPADPTNATAYKAEMSRTGTTERAYMVIYSR